MWCGYSDLPLNQDEYQYLARFLPSDEKTFDKTNSIRRLQKEALSVNRVDVAFKALGTLAPLTFGFFPLASIVSGGIAHFSRRNGRSGWRSLLEYIGLFLPTTVFLAALGSFVALIARRSPKMSADHTFAVAVALFILLAFTGTTSAVIVVRLVRQSKWSNSVRVIQRN